MHNPRQRPAHVFPNAAQRRALEGRLLLEAQVVWNSIPRIWRAGQCSPSMELSADLGKQARCWGRGGSPCAGSQLRGPHGLLLHKTWFLKPVSRPNFPPDDALFFFFFPWGQQRFLRLLHGIPIWLPGLSKHLLIDLLVRYPLCIEGQHRGTGPWTSHPIRSHPKSCLDLKKDTETRGPPEQVYLPF